MDLVMGFTIVCAVALVFAAILGGRFYSQWLVNPRAKYPYGRLIMEIWTTSKNRTRCLVERLAGGEEIKPPHGQHVNLRRFYTPTSIGRVMYPASMPWDFMRVDAPIVAWEENCANAIDPTGETVIKKIQITEDMKVGDEVTVETKFVQATKGTTAKMQRALQQTDILSASEQVVRDENEKEKNKADQGLKGGLRYVPWMVGATLLAAGLGAVLTFQLYQAAGLGGG